MEVKEQKGQDTAIYPESEGYIADDETRPHATALDHHGHAGLRNHSLGEFFSKKGHKLGEPQQEEAKNADAAPHIKYDEGVKVPSFGGSDLDSGYEEGSEGSLSHTGNLSDFSFKEDKREEKPGAFGAKRQLDS